MRLSTLLTLLVVGLLGLSQPVPVTAQPVGATLVTSTLDRPIGLTTDALGRVWVAETGAGPTSNAGGISVVLPDGQVFPFLTDLPTGGTVQEQRSINHLYLDGTDLWFTHNTSATSGFLYRISTAGFSPGDPPRTVADIAQAVDIATFVFAEGFTDSNGYALTKGSDGALYITDAGANAVLRYDVGADVLSVLATFSDLPNPTPVGEPFVQVVPTGIVAADGRLYVSALTGFPFAPGLARVYAVELDGTVNVYKSGLTSLTDLALDPLSGELVALQHGVFSPPPPPPLPGWQPETGRVLRLSDGTEIASAFDLASGLAYETDGTLYVSTLMGELYRIEPVPAACLDPSTMPFYPGGYELSADASRAFLFIFTPVGGSRYEFYNVNNLVIGDPEDASGTPLTGVTRSGDTFDVAPGDEQISAYFPVMPGSAGSRVSFFLRVTDTCGRVVDVDPHFAITGMEGHTSVAFDLAQSHPNPASDAVTIPFSLEAAGVATLAVYDVLGREVARPVQGSFDAGAHTARLDVSTLPPGVYVYRLTAGNRTRTRTLTVTR